MGTKYRVSSASHWLTSHYACTLFYVSHPVFLLSFIQSVPLQPLLFLINLSLSLSLSLSLKTFKFDSLRVSLCCKMRDLREEMTSLFSKMKSLHRKAGAADRSEAKGDGVDRNAVSRLCFHGCSVFIGAVDLFF
ncbi:hypothetical protein ACB094_09G036600 [Castanea mollissima]